MAVIVAARSLKKKMQYEKYRRQNTSYPFPRQIGNYSLFRDTIFCVCSYKQTPKISKVAKIFYGQNDHPICFLIISCWDIKNVTIHTSFEFWGSKMSTSHTNPISKFWREYNLYDYYLSKQIKIFGWTKNWWIMVIS